MKNFLLVFLLLCGGMALGQNVRYDSPFPSISPNSPPFLVANVPPNSPTIQVCKSPANGFPTCSNFQQTYTSSGSPCPNGAQDTPQPQPSACQSTGDAQGNIGFWAPAGQYDYIVCISNNCFGPFTVTLGGTGGGGGGGSPNQSVSFTNATTASLTVGTGTQNIVWNCYDTSTPPQAFDPGTVTVNASTFVVTFNFSSPQSGYCVVNDSGGGGAGNVITQVAALNNVPGKTNGTLAVITDGSSSTDCTIGGGSNNVLCQYNGSTWSAVITSGGAPQAAPPSSPLVNVGSSTPPVYAQGINYVTTAQNWSELKGTALTGCPTGISCATQTLTLAAGHPGIDTTGRGLYEVFLCDGTLPASCASTSEAVQVTGGTYTFASGGTITFVPHNSHTSYIVTSASSGIQETRNLTCGMHSTYSANGACNVIIPANNYSTYVNYYPVYGTIFLYGPQSSLSGYGAVLNCWGRGACIQVGNLTDANQNESISTSGITTRTDGPSNGFPQGTAFTGSNITNTVTASNIQTITTAAAHGFFPGDMVTILFTDDPRYWGDCVISTVPTTTTFTCPGPHQATIATQATPGVVALANVAVLDNGNHAHFTDMVHDYGGATGHFNNWFDFWDDENAKVDHFNNSGVNLNASATWTGSFFFSGGANHVSQQLAPVLTVENADITANFSNCATFYNDNGFHFNNSICQATGLWQVYSANTTGNYQGAEILNMYTECANNNPVSPVHTPFPGTGIAGAIFAESTAAAKFAIHGGTGMCGGWPSGGSGGTPLTFYVIAHDLTAGTFTSPYPVLGWNSTGSDTITPLWARIANGADTITYDLISMTTPTGGYSNPYTGNPYPWVGGCPGGSGGACGSIVTGLTQAAACSGGLVCSYPLTEPIVTSGYSIPQVTSAGVPYGGALNFVAGTLVVQGTGTVNSPVAVDKPQGGEVGLGLGNSPIEAALSCSANAPTSPGGYVVCNTTAASNNVPEQAGLMLTDGFPQQSMFLAKGRLNMLNIGTSTFAHHIVTILDSQPNLTLSTIGYRPPANTNDAFIGTDAPINTALNSTWMSLGASHSITEYIGQLGDGSTQNWLRRLTSSLNEFNVPVQFDLAVTGTNIPIVTSFTTTAATSDNVTVTGMTSGGHCFLQPTNSTAAGLTGVYVSAKTTNQITVTHSATASGTFDVACTSN